LRHFGSDEFLIPRMKVVTTVRALPNVCGSAFFEIQADQSSLF
jgi:hypothetical protein